MSVKKKDLIIILLLILCISMTIFPNYLNNLDEIWNFNFAKNVADGRLPYQDFNMIQGPLLSIICGVFLSVFGTELIVMRFLALVLCAFIMFVIYKILQLLEIQKHVIYISIMAFFLLFLYHFCIDYNFATLLIVLIAMYHELKKVKQGDSVLIHNFKLDFGLGLLIGTTILLKQTTGLFISAIFIMYKLLLVSKKAQLKTFLNIMLVRLLGVLLPVIVLGVYLVTNNIWKDYLDYTFYSLSTFSNYIPYTFLFRWDNITISTLALLVPISILYMYIRSVALKTDAEKHKILFVLFAYSIGTFIFIYPIADDVHFLLGSIPAIIAIIYILWNYCLKMIENDNSKTTIIIKETVKFATYGCLLCIVLTSLIVNFDYILKIKDTSNLNHFKYIPITIEETINEIGEYILEQESKGKKVYMLDASAAVYMIPIDKYNKTYDMFLKGNIGSRGEIRTNRSVRTGNQYCCTYIA